MTMFEKPPLSDAEVMWKCAHILAKRGKNPDSFMGRVIRGALIRFGDELAEKDNIDLNLRKAYNDRLR